MKSASRDGAAAAAMATMGWARQVGGVCGEPRGARWFGAVRLRGPGRDGKQLTVSDTHPTRRITMAGKNVISPLL